MLLSIHPRTPPTMSGSQQRFTHAISFTYHIFLIDIAPRPSRKLLLPKFSSLSTLWLRNSQTPISSTLFCHLICLLWVMRSCHGELGLLPDLKSLFFTSSTLVNFPYQFMVNDTSCTQCHRYPLWLPTQGFLMC